ncbi:MAG: sigma-70 family RNA polymerase sigma factor [Polyangiaceae bacterium]
MTDVPAPNRQLARDVLLVIARDRSRHLAFVRKHLRHHADPEDVLQLALIQAARHLEDLRDSEKVDAWFWRVLRNTITDETRRVARENTLIQRLAATETEANPQQIALCACSLGVLETLKLEYRGLLRRVDIDDLSLAEAAKELGVSTNNATVRLHRARKAMREALLEHCGTDSTSACQECPCESEPAT